MDQKTLTNFIYAKDHKKKEISDDEFLSNAKDLNTIFELLENKRYKLKELRRTISEKKKQNEFYELTEEEEKIQQMVEPYLFLKSITLKGNRDKRKLWLDLTPEQIERIMPEKVIVQYRSLRAEIENELGKTKLGREVVKECVRQSLNHLLLAHSYVSRDMIGKDYERTDPSYHYYLVTYRQEQSFHTYHTARTFHQHAYQEQGINVLDTYQTVHLNVVDKVAGTQKYLTLFYRAYESDTLKKDEEGHSIYAVPYQTPRNIRQYQALQEAIMLGQDPEFYLIDDQYTKIKKDGTKEEVTIYAYGKPIDTIYLHRLKDLGKCPWYGKVYPYRSYGAGTKKEDKKKNLVPQK